MIQTLQPQTYKPDPPYHQMPPKHEDSNKDDGQENSNRKKKEKKMKLTAKTLSLLSRYLNPNKTKLKQPKEKSRLSHPAT